MDAAVGLRRGFSRYISICDGGSWFLLLLYSIRSPYMLLSASGADNLEM